MFLKSVKVRGFKSFARPVEFAFEPGITVVVGPNGSGKSNIADAVLWAMGEQSPTAVRGSSMQDVIFSGSDKMSPSGMAEVEILLDNSSGVLPIEFSEVLVSRRLYRDGDGQYFINRSGCRLIDVGELLSDAGLGRDSHSIISQGKVDSILESRPSERRAHIEEAAGLGKFKKRRRRAERKLEAVRRNLERLADVEEEVKVNLRPLKRQATAAERSARLERQIAVARTRLIKGEMAQLVRELEQAESASRQAGERRHQFERELSYTAEERRRTEEMMATSLKEHKRLAARFYGLKSQKEGLSQRQEAVAQRRSLLSQAGKRAQARTGNLEGQIERATAELNRARSDQSEGQIHLEKVETELQARQEELARVSEELSSRRQASEESSRKVGELGALRDRLSHQIEYLLRRKRKLAADLERSARELESGRHELAGLKQQLKTEEAKLKESSMEMAEADEALGQLDARRSELAILREDAAIELRRVGEELKIAKARLTFIGDSDHDGSGLPFAAKKLSELYDARTIVDLIEVDPGYERAVSAVLGRVLFALAMRDMERARELLDSVRQEKMGSVEFALPGGGSHGPRAEGADYLLDHVCVPEEWMPHVADILAGVRVVEEEPAAGSPDVEGSWVTMDGVFYHQGRRLLSYKSDTPSSVVLKHRNERRHLTQELEAAERRHRELENRMNSLEQEDGLAERKRRDAEIRQRGISIELREAEERQAAFERKIKVLGQELEFKANGREHLSNEENKLDEELRETRLELREAEESLSEMGASSGASDPAREAELTDARAGLEKQVTALQIEAARMREREQVAGRTMERVGPALERLEQELAGARFKCAVRSFFEPVCGELQDVISRMLSAYDVAIGQLEAQLKEAEDLGERNSATLRELSRAEAELQQKLSRASDDTTDCEVGVAKLRDQVDEQEYQLQQLRERFPDAGLAEVQAADEGELEDARGQIERMEKRREQIGPVNPLAQQEYEEMLERQKFLSEQRQDLEKSLNELNSLIRELTERIENTFNATFEAVRRNFTEVVSALFPGGEGRLTIVEPEEETAGEVEEPEAPGEEGLSEEEADDAAAGLLVDRRGIEISVKPARKTVRSLSLLSGGERSLVAIAFLFSIFLARPAPFYILDEVEAALDDTNINRLLNMLRSFQDRTQFIVITHQKRTMEVADVLYGVSMSADGTSKVLSRRMRDGDGDGGVSDEAEEPMEAQAAEPAAIAG